MLHLIISYYNLYHLYKITYYYYFTARVGMDRIGIV